MTIDIASLVTKALSIVSTVAPTALRTVTYKNITSQTYNPTTGANATTTKDYTVTALFTEISRTTKNENFQDHIRQDIQFASQTVRIPYSMLPGSPSLQDSIVDGTTIWFVSSASLDPTGTAMHILEVVKT